MLPLVRTKSLLKGSYILRINILSVFEIISKCLYQKGKMFMLGHIVTNYNLLNVIFLDFDLFT